MGNIIFAAFDPLLSLRIKKIMKIIIPMLTLDTNYGFHELFLK